MILTTSATARLAVLAAGGVLLAGCGSAEPMVSPAPVAAAATTPVLAGAVGAGLLRKIERGVAGRLRRAIPRSGAELLVVDVSCVGTDERRFTCAAVTRARLDDRCRTVESTRRGIVLPGGGHAWIDKTVGNRANDSRLCP
jgi:hypothetical protein